MKRYFLDSLSGERLGPVSVKDLETWIRIGAIDEATPVDDESGFVAAAGVLVANAAQGIPDGYVPPPPVEPQYFAPRAPIASPDGEIAPAVPAPLVVEDISVADIRRSCFLQRKMLGLAAFQFAFNFCVFLVITVNPNQMALASTVFFLGKLSIAFTWLRTMYRLAGLLRVPRAGLFVLGGLLPGLGYLFMLQLNAKVNNVFASVGIKTGFWCPAREDVP